MEQSTQEQSPPTALSPARLLTGHCIPGGVSPADLSAGQRERQEYLSVLRNSRIFRNSMTLTALARVTTHYSADDTIHNCQQHCSVKFDFTIFQFQHLQHLASSSLGNELIAVVCDWRI